MPNVSLIKDDGLPLVQPGSSIVAILSSERAPNKDHPEAKSIIISTFRQVSVYFLAQTAKEVLEEIKKDDAKKTARSWIELPCKGDICAVMKADLLSAEGVDLAKEKKAEAAAEGAEQFDEDADAKPEKDIALRVWFRRPDGREVFTDVDYTPELLTKVIKALDQQRPAPNRPMPGGPAGAIPMVP